MYLPPDVRVVGVVVLEVPVLFLEDGAFGGRAGQRVPVLFAQRAAGLLVILCHCDRWEERRRTRQTHECAFEGRERVRHRITCRVVRNVSIFVNQGSTRRAVSAKEHSQLRTQKNLWDRGHKYRRERHTHTPHKTTTMALGAWPSLLSLLLLPLLISLVHGLKFDIAAHTGHAPTHQRCIRNFVQRETLVVVTAIVDGQRGDGQVLNMWITDTEGNEYGRAKDVVGERRMAFTSHADAAFDVCFENQLNARRAFHSPFFLPLLPASSSYR